MLDTMKIDIYKTQFRQIHSRYNEDRYIQDTINMEVGKKFERKKVRIAEKVELFSSKFFLVHIEAVVL